MFGKILENVEWKKLAYSGFKAVRPLFKKLINDPNSQWDEAALKAYDLLVDTFLKPKVIEQAA